MRREWKGIFKIACIYMATIIGAGFASGQEIVQFFSNYYRGGFFGILLAGLLFAVIGYVVLDKVYTERIRTYDELLFPAVGWLVGWVVEVAASLFMLSVFCIMIAGAGNVLLDQLGIPFRAGTILMAALVMMVLLTEMRGIFMLGSVVTPVLILGMITVGVYIILSRDTSVFSFSTPIKEVTHNWFFSSLLYVGYNSIMAIVVMCSLLPYLKTRRIGTAGGFLGGVMLCVIALILNIVLFVLHPDSVSKELPLLHITRQYGSILTGGYAILLGLAMFVSAVTSGYCFVDRVNSKLKMNRKLITVLLCILIAPLSNLGFSNLISKVYPVFGYIGLFVVLVLLLQSAPKYLLGKALRNKRI